jgi:hypothetical protein
MRSRAPATKAQKLGVVRAGRDDQRVRGYADASDCCPEYVQGTA